MKKIAYVLQGNPGFYNIYDMHGTIIGGTSVSGELQSMSTNGDTYTITVLKDNCITAYTFDINNRLIGNTPMPYRKPVANNTPKNIPIQQPIIKENNVKTTSNSDTTPRIFSPSNFVGPLPSDEYANPIKNNLSRLFHLIHGVVLGAVVLLVSAVIFNPVAPFVFLYVLYWRGITSYNRFFTWRRRIYNIMCWFMVIVFVAESILLCLYVMAKIA